MSHPEPSPDESAPAVKKIDFFISYTKADKQWAEWIAWQLEAAGYLSHVQAWDATPGSGFVEKIHSALQLTDKVLAILSAAYLKSSYEAVPWQQAIGRRNTEPALLTFRIEDVAPPGLLEQIVYVDLFGVDEAVARERLLTAAQGRRAKPTRPPAFPAPHFPSEAVAARPNDRQPSRLKPETGNRKRPSSAQIRELATVLARLAVMSSPQNRDEVVSQLPDALVQAVPYNARTDVYLPGLLRVCLDRTHGLRDLLAILDYFEGGTNPMAEFRAVAERVLADLNEGTLPESNA